MPFRPGHIPAAAVVAAIALMVPAAPASAGRCAAATARPTSGSVRQASRATLCLLNVERRKHYLRPLHENDELDRAARGHSRSMVRDHYFDHGDFVGRIRRAGYQGDTLGENIAWGSGPLATPKSIVRMWMHSPGHRAKILRASFTPLGIGVAIGAPQAGVTRAATYTTDFGRPA